MGTFFLTIVTGVSVIVLGQWIVKAVIDPIQQMRRTIGEIDFALSFYANFYLGPGGDSAKYHEASGKLRALSCQLISDTHVVPLYRLWMVLLCLPEPPDIDIAATNLIYMSNKVFDKPDQLPAINAKADEIRRKLRIRSLLS